MSDNVWQTKILLLLANGWKMREIAAHIGLTTQSLFDLRRGRTIEPKGMAAVLLHNMMVGPPRRTVQLPGQSGSKPK
ncbi:hypothetical protein [Acidiphilium sp.]|uniref:hypothetical protein n=1 Tax=Acidiphilium sp. TaxID=527 RepID=UPI00258F6D36|nr:hypothetical protein [Acidiphilium sp.]